MCESCSNCKCGQSSEALVDIPLELPYEVKELLVEASDAAGKSVEDFVLDAALHEAMKAVGE